MHPTGSVAAAIPAVDLFWVIVTIGLLVGSVLAWKKVQEHWLRTFNRPMPPFARIVLSAMWLALWHNRRTVIPQPAPGPTALAGDPLSKTRLPFLTWRLLAWIGVLSIAALTAVGQFENAWPIALLIGLPVIWQTRSILRARAHVQQQMFDVAAAECKYRKGDDPRSTIRVRQWNDLVRPGTTVVQYPAGFHSEDERVRDKFERNFSAAVSAEHSFTYEWNSAGNHVVCTPTPYLPQLAPYPGRDTHPWNQFPLGIAAGGGEAVWDVAEIPHCLLAGSTGGGKSYTQRILLLHALSLPDEWKIVLLDPKRVELSAYAHYNNVVQVETELAQMVELLESCEQEMHLRYKEMEKLGVNHFKKIPVEPGVPPKAAILILIDELFSLLTLDKVKTEEGKEIDALKGRAAVVIGSILRLGRAAGVHTVAATQRPGHEALSGEAKQNMDARIACGRLDTTGSNMVLDSQHATRLPLIKGRSVLRLGSEYVEMQTYKLDQEDVEDTVTLLRHHREQLAAATGPSGPANIDVTGPADDVAGAVDHGDVSTAVDGPSPAEHPLDRLAVKLKTWAAKRASYPIEPAPRRMPPVADAVLTAEVAASGSHVTAPVPGPADPAPLPESVPAALWDALAAAGSPSPPPGPALATVIPATPEPTPGGGRSAGPDDVDAIVTSVPPAAWTNNTSRVLF